MSNLSVKYKPYNICLIGDRAVGKSCFIDFKKEYDPNRQDVGQYLLLESLETAFIVCNRSNAEAAILVYDTTRRQTYLSLFVILHKLNQAGLKTVLLGTKTDLFKRRQVDLTEVRALGAIYNTPVFELSAQRAKKDIDQVLKALLHRNPSTSQPRLDLAKVSADVRTGIAEVNAIQKQTKFILEQWPKAKLNQENQAVLPGLQDRLLSDVMTEGASQVQASLANLDSVRCSLMLSQAQFQKLNLNQQKFDETKTSETNRQANINHALQVLREGINSNFPALSVQMQLDSEPSSNLIQPLSPGQRLTKLLTSLLSTSTSSSIPSHIPIPELSIAKVSYPRPLKNEITNNLPITKPQQDENALPKALHLHWSGVMVLVVTFAPCHRVSAWNLERLSVIGGNELDKVNGDTWPVSDLQVFRQLTATATAAFRHFQAPYDAMPSLSGSARSSGFTTQITRPSALAAAVTPCEKTLLTLEDFLPWFTFYSDLFGAKCTSCGRHLACDAELKQPIPPIVRTFDQGLPYHVQCL